MRWAVLWKDLLIGPYWFENSVTSEMYFNMLGKKYNIQYCIPVVST
jgi:hypothetical protein